MELRAKFSQLADIWHGKFLILTLAVLLISPGCKAEHEQTEKKNISLVATTIVHSKKRRARQARLS